MIKIKMLKHATCVLLVGQQVYPNIHFIHSGSGLSLVYDPEITGLR